MGSCMMCMFIIALCLGLLVTYSFGELVMIRQQLQVGYELTCMSEYDLTAFVWNDDLQYPRNLKKSRPIQPRITPYCAIANEYECIVDWRSMGAWEVVHSTKYPMGPVFDFRWEEFTENVFPRDGKYCAWSITSPTPSGSTVFSVRGLGDIDLQLCERDRGPENRCFWITIAASPNKPFVVRPWVHKRTGVTNLSKEEYDDEIAYTKSQLVVDAYKWRTFILKWNEDQKQIEIHSDNKLIITKQLDAWINISCLFVRSSDAGLIRFHKYNYLLTKQADTKLSTKLFYHARPNFCYEFVVSLCKGCGLEVRVVFNKKVYKINSIFGNEGTAYGKLPTWQFVTLNKTLENFNSGNIHLEMLTKFNGTGNSGRWAIDSFHECESKKIYKWSIRTRNKSEICGCQKLSYRENAVIRSDAQMIYRSPSKCSDVYYGYYCQETCVFCKYRFCDKITGCGSTKLQAPNVLNSAVTEASSQYPKPAAEGVQNIPSGVQEGGIRTQTSATSSSRVTHNNRRMSTNHCSELRKPKNLTATCLSNSKVTLRWDYPLYLPGSNTRFSFRIEKIDSNLLKQLSYPTRHDLSGTTVLNSIEVYLRSSTKYRFNVYAVNSCISSELACVEFQVPASLGFSNGEKLEVNRTGTLIELKLPSIVNETQTSVVTVIVKGSSKCTRNPVPADLQKLVNMTESHKGWIAAKYKNPCTRPQSLTIGKNPIDTLSKNCAIYPKETYVIAIVVIDSIDKVSAVITSKPILPIYKKSANEITDDKHEKSNSSVLWLALPLILSICFLLVFIWRRKFLHILARMRQQNITLCWQTLTNFVKSTITCTSLQSPPLAAIPDIELSGINSRPETVTCNHYSQSITIKDFEDYVKESITSGLLHSQFMMIPRGQHYRACKSGSLPANMPKNRYTNIIAYDDSRVVLKKIPGEPYSDYINANYIQSVHREKAYIATQGPKSETVVDFWRMIWQEEALVICMLANVIEDQKVKCEKYWPEFGAVKTYGDIVVVTENHHVFADYTFRTLRIEHLHYTGWPDHVIPVYTHSVTAYLMKLRTTTVGKGPIIVHCSAGVGRTGTIILCDICLHQATTTGTVDVMAEFRKLRDSRMNMVDNQQQYLFAHLVLVECLVSLPTKLPCNNDLPRAIEELKKALPQHIERLCNIVWQDQAMLSLVTPKFPLPEELTKNRFPELAPVSSSLVYLERYPRYDCNSDYISAVIVDGLRVKNQYLASQLPLPSTLSDFWRLIANQRVELVIILQQPDPNDLTCCDIVPDEIPFNPVPFLNVKLTGSSYSEKSPQKIDELLLTDSSEETERTQQVTLLTCTEWGLGRNGKPPPPVKLVEFWVASENIHREKGPTLILCHNGVTGCGLYLALSLLLERMALERECDIIFAARAIRRSRPDFLQSQEQFEYLYDAAAKYVESFEMYANFS